MANFPLHDLDSAPEAARTQLKAARSKMGFVPNLFAKMAEAPAVLEGYTTLSGIFEGSSLSPAEQQVILMTAAVENGCEFCVAAHTGGAKQAKVSQDVIDALRNEQTVPDERLRALSEFTRAVVRDRGWVGDDAVQRFMAADFTRQNVLEVVLGVALKTLSNYTNHIAGTPLNEELAALKWTKS